MTTTPHEAASTGAADRPLNLAEYFLLLDLDERGGRLLLDGSTSGLALAGAVLADLAGRGHLTVTRDEVLVGPASGSVVEGLERPLAQVLGIIADHGREHPPRDAEQWINRFSRSELREALLQSLESRGIIEHTEGKVLGLFRRERYPEADPNPELDLRARIGEVLYGSAPADAVTWPLISCCAAPGCSMWSSRTGTPRICGPCPPLRWVMSRPATRWRRRCRRPRTRSPSTWWPPPAGRPHWTEPVPQRRLRRGPSAERPWRR